VASNGRALYSKHNTLDYNVFFSEKEEFYMSRQTRRVFHFEQHDLRREKDIHSTDGQYVSK